MWGVIKDIWVAESGGQSSSRRESVSTPGAPGWGPKPRTPTYMVTDCSEEVEKLIPPLLLVGVQTVRLPWTTD